MAIVRGRRKGPRRREQPGTGGKRIVDRTGRRSISLDAARRAVAEVSRRLASSGMVPATAGNVSVRVRDLVAITPTGVALAELTRRRCR